MLRILFVFWMLAAGVVSAAELRYARNFNIVEREGYRKLSIRNTWTGAGDHEQIYALVPVGKEVPKLAKGVVVVRTPVERAVIFETVFLGPIQDLGLHDKLVGIAHLDFVNDPIARARVGSGLAKSVQTGAAMEIETLMALRPGLILTSTTGNSMFDTHPSLLRAGLPVLVSAGYMEEHPLGRAEWIKCIGALFEKDAEAKAVFDAVADRYEELVALTRTVAHRPSVMNSAPYGGVWHVAGGRSYTAQWIQDAGGRYLWSRFETGGGVPLDMEVIVRDAAEAEVWLNPSHYGSLAALRAADARFDAFRALREGRVYNNTRRVNEKGGNDIYERGVSHPEEVLADLIAILHPELLPDHEPVYYEQLR